jgi:hypothetical protein
MYRFDDRYSSSSRVAIVDVPASSSLRVLVSREFSHRSIGLMYLEGNSPHVIYFSNFQNQNTVALDNLSLFCSVRNVMLAQKLKSVHRPLALKSPIILRDSLLVSGNQCFSSVTVSSCRHASAFHQVTPHVCFY